MVSKINKIFLIFSLFQLGILNQVLPQEQGAPPVAGKKPIVKRISEYQYNIPGESVDKIVWRDIEVSNGQAQKLGFKNLPSLKEGEKYKLYYPKFVSGKHLVRVHDGISGIAKSAKEWSGQDALTIRASDDGKLLCITTAKSVPDDTWGSRFVDTSIYLADQDGKKLAVLPVSLASGNCRPLSGGEYIVCSQYCPANIPPEASEDLKEDCDLGFYQKNGTLINQWKAPAWFIDGISKDGHFVLATKRTKSDKALGVFLFKQDGTLLKKYDKGM